MTRNDYIHKIIWLLIFGIAMAFVESAVVVYLRAIYYPEGFGFPLKAFTDYKILIEVMRELATIFMLLSVACLAGKRFWERFAYFILSFGIWDIFYYVWLKVLLDWPSSIFEWDILFLIPIPWIGPVIAPVSVSVIMIIAGILIARSYYTGENFRPVLFSHILAIIGTALILYTFMYDIDATLRFQMPEPYRYELLITGDVLFIAAFVISYKKSESIQNKEA